MVHSAPKKKLTKISQKITKKAPKTKEKTSRKPASQPAKFKKQHVAKSTERAPAGMAGVGFGAIGGATASKTLEIRGQARTLSMMLILRNGKEDVNFVKVRQDYSTEIAKTEF